MAKKSRPSVLKRQREARKREKAAQKRERREQFTEAGSRVATKEDLEGYGLIPATPTDGEKED